MMVVDMKKQKIRYEPFEGMEYQLTGITDVKYIMFPTFITLTMMLISALILVAYFWGMALLGFLIILSVYIGLLIFIDGGILLGVYLLYRKSYIKIDKSGICGKGKLMGERGLMPKEFSYTWKEIEKVVFDHQSYENQIVIVTKDDVYSYSYTYRFVARKTLLAAIRTFGKINLLDDENIKEIQDSYSYKYVILESIGTAFLCLLVIIIKFFLKNNV